MPWFKVDDNLAFHQKVLRAGNAAMGMWVRAGAECSNQLTDGFVSVELVGLLGGKALARKLVAARLWHEVDGGYQFHEWNETGRQPTREQVERDRKAAQTRKERWKERRHNDDGTPDGTESERRSERDENKTHTRASSRPDPTRPDPTQEETPSESPRRRATSIPTDWTPTPELITWQREAGISDLVARRELPRFRDYWAGIAGEKGRKADWPATWRNWLRRAADEPPGRPPPANGHQPSTADQRVAQGMTLAQELRREEATQAKELAP